MVFDKVCEMIADVLQLDPSTITPDSDISGQLEADSLDIIEIVTNLEDEYGIHFPDEELANMKKVSDLVDYIEKNI